MGWGVPTGRGSGLVPNLVDVSVLVVDDDDDMGQWLALVLQSARAQVRVVDSAAEAFAVLQRWQPDVIVSDIEMPGEDGFSLIRRVRDLAEPERASTPAFALSAHARLVDVRMARDAGFDWHMAKPVEPHELLKVVAALARRNPRRMTGYSA